MIARFLPLEEWGTQGAIEKEAVAVQVVEGVQWLIRAGADLVAVPCNTVHEWYPRYCTLGVPVIHIIHETLREATTRLGRYLADGPIGVLCSAQTRLSRLYERHLPVIYPTEQRLVDEAIYSVMSGRPGSIQPLVEELRRAGAPVIILGCTELGLCRGWNSDEVIDSNAVLADVTVKRLLE
jgi:aspartate racemase